MTRPHPEDLAAQTGRGEDETLTAPPAAPAERWILERPEWRAEILVPLTPAPGSPTPDLPPSRPAGGIDAPIER